MAAVEIDRPQRWDEPFAQIPLTDAEIERILRLPPFSGIDPSAFLSLPLVELLRNDSRIVRRVKGDLVFRRGDYGTSAFFVLAGRVRILLEADERDLERQTVGGAEREPRSWLGALNPLRASSQVPEARSYDEDDTDPRLLSEGPYLKDPSSLIEASRSALVEAGGFFGELSALGRTPRQAAVVAESAVELLEMRWQGLREIYRRDAGIRARIDALYRSRMLDNELVFNPIFRNLADAERRRLAAEIVFQSYGNREWSARAPPSGPDMEVLGSEPLIAEEGSYPNELLLIRSGFARVSRRYGNGHRTTGYLGQGRLFGFEEIAEGWKTGEPQPYRQSLRAVGYADVLAIPTRAVEEIVLPALPEGVLRSEGRSGPQPAPGDDVLDRVVDGRYLNGTATMLIDMDRCTRCDDCVRACAATHDGNPRFVRHGERVGRFMIANACMHCADPVCMIGCPTGAIRRLSEQGQVVINDRTCIGCGTCAANCPYDNIRLVEIRDRSGALLLDRKTRAPILKATKCDLCADQAVSPACARACPHDALRRVDMRDAEHLLELIQE